MYDPTTGRWLTMDPLMFEAGDDNLYRYVGNDPTNATDPSGLEALPTQCGQRQEKAKVCSITSVTLVRSKAELPKIVSVVRPVFPPVNDGGDLNVLGPYKDPKKIGNFDYVLWVVWEGSNMTDCSIERYVVYEAKYGKMERHKPEGGTFTKGKKIGIAGSARDGPDPMWLQPKASEKYLAVADNPGFSFLKPDWYPAYYKMNFYEIAKSKSDGTIKGEIWYDVVIEVKAPGDATVMECTLTGKNPK